METRGTTAGKPESCNTDELGKRAVQIAVALRPMPFCHFVEGAKFIPDDDPEILVRHYSRMGLLLGTRNSHAVCHPC